MRILLTNDDGIHAEGLAALERIARELSDDVWIVAPESDQSGLAHSLTLSEPLRLRQVGEKKFALKGTPTDCVIMAIRKLMAGGKPDLVLSGVNSGANMAEDVTYSGTVAGAIEGALNGVRSFALSQAYTYDGGRIVPWEVAETHAPGILRQLMHVDLPEGSFLNINFPNCRPEEVAGVVVTKQGKLDYGVGVEERQDGRGFPYYWLTLGGRTPREGEGTDLVELRNRKISVTPLKLDMTDYAMQDRVARALADGGNA